MIADADQHRSEDARIRQETDARNELDAVAYQVDRQLAELGDSAPTHEKARAEMLVSDARQAVKEAAPLDRVRSLTQELQQVFQGLSTRRQESEQGQGTGQPDGQPGGNDDVIDADFTTADE
jgi:molecular chaperone DnaK